MRLLAAVTTLALAFSLAGASAQEAAPPDITGVWSGPFKTVIFGHNAHHPGNETLAQPPRVREITFTMAFEGQDSIVAWGHSWSDPSNKEPFGIAFGPDGKSGMGADTDGSLTVTITGPDRMEVCYAHTGLSPSQAIVASCGVLTKAP
jgi:hypothetical protein